MLCIHENQAQIMGFYGGTQLISFSLLPVKKLTCLYLSKTVHAVAQSICTHYSCFENKGRFATLKKYGPEKSRVQKTGSLLFKKRRGQSMPDPKKISGRPDELEKWVQIDWTNLYLPRLRREHHLHHHHIQLPPENKYNLWSGI